MTSRWISLVPSKIYAAYIRRAGRELLARLRAAADPDDPASARLHAGIVEFLRFADERRDGWQVLHAEASAAGGPLADELAALRRDIAKIVKPLLVQGSGATKGSPDATLLLEGTAHAFVGAGEALADWWLARGELSAERAAELLVSFVRRGVETASAGTAEG